MYDATSLLASAVAQGKPFIFAAVNYRVAGFGFLPGKEVLADGAANLGHLDQRYGVLLIHPYLIADFLNTSIHPNQPQ